MKNHASRTILVSMCFALLLGCNRTPVPDAQPTPRTPSSGASASKELPRTTNEQQTIPLLPSLSDGTFKNSGCGERDYLRVIELDNGHFTMHDRVSPCPEGARCVWSGIATYKGSFDVQRPAAPGGPFLLQLDYDGPPHEAAQPRPTHLEWYESRGDLTEPAGSCQLRREL